MKKISFEDWSRKNGFPIYCRRSSRKGFHANDDYIAHLEAENENMDWFNEKIKEIESVLDAVIVENKKKNEKIEKLKALLELVDDHEESCSIFIYDEHGCTCSFEKIRTALQEDKE